MKGGEGEKGRHDMDFQVKAGRWEKLLDCWLRGVGEWGERVGGVVWVM